ncbi:MAG: EF-P 5-aminopentanol modification-associated protein YfmH [Mycoplasmatales bacterium]
MNELKINELLNKVNYKVLDNGFKIIYYANTEYKKFYVNYTINYGAVDYTYQKNNKTVQHNPGIAHFLEHIMFNMPYGDAFEKFSDLLASPNAYTSHTKTSYLFSSSQNIEENLQILLEMVNTFYLTEAKLQKEKGIILEEIGMYDKNPDWQIYKQSLKNSIKTSKYKEDILGSETDVKDMTFQMLKEAYTDFYQPKNQFLVIVGPQVENLVQIVEDYMTLKTNIPNYDINKIVQTETMNVLENQTNNYFMEVSQNYLAITYKELQKVDYTIKDKIYLEILLELLFTNFNDKYILYEEQQALDYSFMYDFIMYKNLKLLLFYITNKDLQKFSYVLDDILTSGPNIKLEQTIKNKYLGKFIKSFNNEKVFAEQLSNFEENQINIQEYYQILKNFQIKTLNTQLNQKILLKIKTIISNKML